MAQIFVLASGKGGVGKSSLTVGLGKALVSLNKKVLLIDTDIGLQSLDVLLGCSETLVYDWGDVILGRCDNKSAVYTAECGVDLLSCPRKFDDAFTGDAFNALVHGFDGEYDFILIDAPAGIGSGLKLACSAADFGLVISTSDSVCVRSAGKAADMLESYGIEQTRLIINRFRRRAIERNLLLNVDSVIDETEVQLIGVVPEDPIINYGAVFTKGQLSNAALTRIARRLTGENVPLKLKNKGD